MFPEYIKADADHIFSIMQLGLGGMLLVRYKPYFGEKAHFLSAAVVNYALLRQPANEQATAYLQTHRVLIEQQANLIRYDKHLLPAFSVLYSFHCFRFGAEHPDLTLELCDRASSLGCVLYSVQQVCGDTDTRKYLVHMKHFAESLFKDSHEEV